MKLKPKALRKQKKIANGNTYPEENNPFGGEYEVGNITHVRVDANGHVVKEKRGKNKKNKKIEVKSLEGKRERAVSEAISNIVPEKHTASNNTCLFETSTVHINTEKSVTDAVVTQPATCKEPLSLPAIQVHDYSQSKPKKLNPQKKPSQGDIRALRNRKPKYTPPPNRFENEDVCEEAKEDSIPPAQKPEASSEKQSQSQSRLHRTSSLIISSKERKHKRRLKLIKKLKQKKKEKKENKESTTSVAPDGRHNMLGVSRSKNWLFQLGKENTVASPKNFVF